MSKNYIMQLLTFQRQLMVNPMNSNLYGSTLAGDKLNIFKMDEIVKVQLLSLVIETLELIVAPASISPLLWNSFSTWQSLSGTGTTETVNGIFFTQFATGMISFFLGGPVKIFDFSFCFAICNIIWKRIYVSCPVSWYITVRSIPLRFWQVLHRSEWFNFWLLHTPSPWEETLSAASWTRSWKRFIDLVINAN